MQGGLSENTTSALPRQCEVAALPVPAQCQTRPFSSRRTLQKPHDSSPAHYCAQKEDSWTSGSSLACSPTCLQGAQSSHASQRCCSQLSALIRVKAGSADDSTWALQLLDGNKRCGIVGEVAVGEGAHPRHRRGRAALPVRPAGHVQRAQPAQHACRSQAQYLHYQSVQSSAAKQNTYYVVAVSLPSCSMNHSYLAHKLRSPAGSHKLRYPAGSQKF